MIQESGMFRIDKTTDKKLEILAEHENRTKIGELRYLIKIRAKELGLKTLQVPPVKKKLSKKEAAN